MRPIDNTQLMRAANLDQLNAENDAVGTDAETTWEDFLRDYPQDAQNLRTGMWAIGLLKCWFSEALLQQGEGHIEHYRPKRRLAGDRHDGYRWRTFDWHNLRLAHSTVNFRRTDYLSKRLMGKGSYFPLRDPRSRATNAAEEINEEPVLLDPILATDTYLITFDAASGAPRPRFRKEDNEWLHRRAVDSIAYYHLNEGTWNYKRADRMAAVQKLCEQLEDIAMTQPRNQEAYDSKINEIVKYINSFAEFSTACLQVVRERGLLEHFALGL